MKISLFVIVFGLSLSIPGGGEAAFGGHDLFTSLAQLEVLWHNDREVVKDMEVMIKKMDKAKKSLEK